MCQVVDIRGLSRSEAGVFVGRKLAEVEPCTEVLCIAGNEDSHPAWGTMEVAGEGLVWRPLVVDPGRVLLTLRRESCQGEMGGSVLDFMQRDHERINAIIEALNENTKQREGRVPRTLVELLIEMLRRHMEIEDTLLLPIIAKRYDAGDYPMAKLDADHFNINSVLEEILGFVETGDLMEAGSRAHGLGLFLREHILREEKLVYGLADQYLDSDERASLLDFCRVMA